MRRKGATSTKNFSARFFALVALFAPLRRVSASREFFIARQKIIDVLFEES
jgi:hypothetical protein